ncbi:MAG: hypothetical protein IJA10_11310 [Lachnospiraceae bacterium]|nr:hypothetical protein [Lachnospiraceae bacterium]
MKANISAKIDREKLDRLIETYRNTKEFSCDSFLIMSNETGVDLMSEDSIAHALGCRPSHYKDIRIAYCDSVKYGEVHIR